MPPPPGVTLSPKGAKRPTAQERPQWREAELPLQTQAGEEPPQEATVTDLFNLKKSRLETPRTSVDTVPLRTVGFAGQPVSV